MQAIARFNRVPLIAGGRTLNTFWDFVFYDISSLTSAEMAGLSAHTHPEGSILIAHPKDEDQEIETLTPWEFISSQKKSDSRKIDSIVVAGVGSSALGTASLARNLADYLGRPVAGIVSGFGLADVVSEALGGWFVFGLKNSIRDFCAKVFDAFNMKDHVWDDISYRSLVKDDHIAGYNLNRFVYGSPDSAALLLVLYHLRTQIKMLLGHSKGNYVIENVLEGLISLCGFMNQDIPEDLQVVTLGAAVRFPGEFSKKTDQFIGCWDCFGMMNSRPKLETHWIPGAGHSLNTCLTVHMAVGEVLKLMDIE